MKVKMHIGFMGILVKMVDPIRVEHGTPPFYAMDNVSFF